MDSNGTPVSPPPSTLAERVRRVLADAPAPLDFTKVKTAVGKLYPKGTKKAPLPPKPSDTEIQRELEVAGVFIHPPPAAKGKPKYWHQPPLTPAELVAKAVREKVAALGDDEVVTEAKLGKPAGKKATPETLRVFADTVADLLRAGSLHRHGKNLGKRPPPSLAWYEVEPAKKAFAALVTAAKKVVGLNAAPVDEVMAALRERLGITPPTEKPKPVVPPPVAPPVPPPAHADLRAVLKQAYDHLCQFVEFRDKLVELPRLYREAAKHLPTLSAEAFKAELWRMGDEHKVQLHIINDVTAAKEPHLAISRAGDLYYYARWN
jgi:hypothetical protein